jgi:hypothetical protein
MLEYIIHLEELAIVSMIRDREFRIVLLRFRILEGGGGREEALKISKTWGGGIENLPISSTWAL